MRYPLGRTWAAHGLPLSCRWDARELTMNYLREVHGLTMGCS